MNSLFASLSLAALVAMAVISIALLGNKIDPLPAAALETGLFIALMWVSGRIEPDL